MTRQVDRIIPGLSYAIDYALHVEELEAQLAQIVGPDFHSDALKRVEYLMMSGHTRLTAITQVITECTSQKEYVLP